MTQTLPTAVLGRTGLEVSRLGYGTALRNQPNHEQWGRLLNTVLDSGINFIDTANDYGVAGITRSASGPAEEEIGRHISARRSDYRLATKCGCGPDGHIWTRENAFRGLHESLERLKTDYVDIMQYHNPTVEECEAGDLVAVLQDMKAQGKVRWLGISTTLPHLPTYLDWGVFDTFQIPYSALERDHEDWIAKSAEAGTGIIIRGGVAQGEPEVGSGRADRWQKFEEAGLDELMEEGETRTTFVLRYTLTHPYSHTNIVGTSNLDHLQENIRGILRGPLSEDVYVESKRRLDAAGETPSPVE
jgi:aryl-alcohol dehydrogenase-like predicted oxidoreductase